jgi:AGZA family xanthine/uracil permease-like MFS transporter
MEDFLDRFFSISKRGSSIGQEIRGGTATFLTMSYILLVNPQVLAKIGIPPTDVGKRLPHIVVVAPFRLT